MKIHHATVKWAGDRGITLTSEGYMFVATKGTVRRAWADAKTAARACAFDALIKSDYPSLRLEYNGTDWEVLCHKPSEPATEDTPATTVKWVMVWESAEPPNVEDLEDIATACDEEGLDIEALFDEDAEDEERATGSVVALRYKVIYAERGDATNCGDWLAKALKALLPTVSLGGKLVVDVVTLDIVFRDNGVESLSAKWGRAYHDPGYRSNGWEGRFSMSGRNVLRKRVADAGHLIFGDEKHMAPLEWCDEHRTAPKRTKKDKPDASGEHPTAPEAPADTTGEHPTAPEAPADTTGEAA